MKTNNIPETVKGLSKRQSSRVLWEKASKGHLNNFFNAWCIGDTKGMEIAYKGVKRLEGMFL